MHPASARRWRAGRVFSAAANESAVPVGSCSSSPAGGIRAGGQRARDGRGRSWPSASRTRALTVLRARSAFAEPARCARPGRPRPSSRSSASRSCSQLGSAERVVAAASAVVDLARPVRQTRLVLAPWRARRAPGRRRCRARRRPSRVEDVHVGAAGADSRAAMSCRPFASGSWTCGRRSRAARAVARAGTRWPPVQRREAASSPRPGGEPGRRPSRSCMAEGGARSAPRPRRCRRSAAASAPRWWSTAAW